VCACRRQTKQVSRTFDEQKSGGGYIKSSTQYLVCPGELYALQSIRLASSSGEISPHSSPRHSQHVWGDTWVDPSRMISCPSVSLQHYVRCFTVHTLQFIALFSSVVLMPPEAGLWHLHTGDQGPWVSWLRVRVSGKVSLKLLEL